MNEKQLLGIRLQMEALISEREGMLAANQCREMNGYTQAYGDESFFGNAEDFKKLAVLLEGEGVKVRGE